MVPVLGLIMALGAWGPAPSLASADTQTAHKATEAQCVTVRTEARYRAYGYDHLVHLKNACEKGVVCTVSTNVNPKEQQVSLDAGASTTVVTFVGSPARTFQAKVSCRFR